MKISFKNIKLCSLVALLTLITVLPVFAMESSQKIQKVSVKDAAKQERWAAMEKEVDSWTDACGMPIDPHIKKMVIVLNLLGFKTEHSCEGHINWGRLYPWVTLSVQNSDLEVIKNEWEQIRTLIDEKTNEIHKKHPELSIGDALRVENSQELKELYPKSHSLERQLEIAPRLNILPFRNLLTDFYHQNQVNPDTMLYLSELGFFTFDLHSIGGDWQIIRDENEKRQKLEEYRKEMDAFAEFLTERYFGN